MTEVTSRDTATAIHDPKPTQAVESRQERHDATPHQADQPDRSVYLQAALACLPRWRLMLGIAPWLDDGSTAEPSARNTPLPLHRRLSAALAVGMLADRHELDGPGDQWHDHLHTALVQWQLSMRGNGKPFARSHRTNPLHGALADLVVQFAGQTTAFRSESLIDDLRRHLGWLTTRPARVPWMEATTIAALADGAVVVRDDALIGHAGRRLTKLLQLQDAEGWFPERGGADTGRLSLTIDALARLHSHGRWPELHDSIARALRFLVHFVLPGDQFGGSFNSCGTAFLSPHGVELLAPEFPDAAALAGVCRRRMRDFAERRLPGWHDDLLALLGPRLSAAAAAAPNRLTAPPLPHETTGSVRFPNAGLSIESTDAYHAVVCTRRGGAFRITWRHDGTCQDESGITVVFAHGLRTAGRWSPRTRAYSSGNSLIVSGALRRPAKQATGLRQWLFRWMRPRHPDAPKNSPRDGRADRPIKHLNHTQLTHDCFERELTFGPNWVRIRDEILCRLPCMSVICQSPSPGSTERLIDDTSQADPPATPIYAAGGRRVQIIRRYRLGKLDQCESAKPGTQDQKPPTAKPC